MRIAASILYCRAGLQSLTMSLRRELTYDDWDQVLSDLRKLAAGNTPHGKWNLTQSVKHLNDWLTFPMDGFPQAHIPIRWMLAAMRLTVGKSTLKKIISSRKMSDGVPTMPQTVYADDDQAQAAAVSQIEGSIERFRSHSGPIHASPIFGEMDKHTAEQLQLVHFAHHLSWLTPNND